MPELTRARARKVNWLTRRLDLPELGDGEYAYVRKFSAREVMQSDLFKDDVKANTDDLGRIVEMAIMGLCTKDGKPLFKACAADRKTLADTWPFDALCKVVQAFADFNGLGTSLDDTAKNSRTPRNGRQRIR